MKDAPEDLKMERLRRGWTLQDASDRTRINLTVLKALESGKIAEVGSPATVEAFIAKYRAAFGMEESRCEERPLEAQKPADRSRPILYVLFGALIGAFLVALCFGGIFRKSFHSPKSPAANPAASSARKPAPPASAASAIKMSNPAAIESKAPEAKKKVPAVSALPAAAGKPSESASKEAPSVSTPQEATPASATGKEKTTSTEGVQAKTPGAKKTAPAVSPLQATAGTSSKPAVPGAATGLTASVGAPVAADSDKRGPVAATVCAPAPEKISSASASKQTPQAGTSPHSLQVSAEKKTWVQVTLDGRKTESVLLQPGQSREWSAAKKVYLIVGNAGGVNVLWDGKPVSMSKTPGRVIRMSLPEN